MTIRSRSLPALALLASTAVLLPDASLAQTASGLPLTTPRTIRFTTDEVSWMSVDVSPDGTTILFDLLGDLYTLAIGGGAATRITSGPAYDVQPRFSPDGTRIV